MFGRALPDKPSARRRKAPPATKSGAVVHLAAQYWLWARTGGLAEAVHGLAETLASRGVPTSVFMPLYRSVRMMAAELEPVGDPLVVHFGPRVDVGRVFRLRDPASGPAVYFIDHPRYFDRDGIYGGTADYPDNARRFGFFAAAALQALPALVPDAAVVHAHDWHTALAPVLARIRHAGERFYDRLAMVFSVHNAGYQGLFPFDRPAWQARMRIGMTREFGWERSGAAYLRIYRRAAFGRPHGLAVREEEVRRPRLELPRTAREPRPLERELV